MPPKRFGLKQEKARVRFATLRHAIAFARLQDPLQAIRVTPFEVDIRIRAQQRRTSCIRFCRALMDADAKLNRRRPDRHLIAPDDQHILRAHQPQAGRDGIGHAERLLLYGDIVRARQQPREDRPDLGCTIRRKHEDKAATYRTKQSCEPLENGSSRDFEQYFRLRKSETGPAPRGRDERC